MRALSLRAGMSESAVKEILSGRARSPRHDTIAGLARALGCSSSDLTGDEPLAALRRAPGLAPSTRVTEVDVHASAGGGAVVESEQPLAEWQFPTDWLRAETRGALGGLRVITIDGDSMTPTLTPGDKVIIDLNRTTPSPPGLFAIWDGLALVAKRLEYIEGSDPPTVRIISDNEAYRPYTRTTEEVRVVGRIRGRWQRF